MFTQMSAKSISHRCPCETILFETIYARRLTSWLSKLSNDVGFPRWLAKQRLKFQTSPSFVNKKYQVWGCVFSVRTKGKVFYFAWFFVSLIYFWYILEPFVKLFGYHWVCEKKNRSLMFSVDRKIPTLRSTVPVGTDHSSGKLDKRRFPLERWTLGLGFSCPHYLSWVRMS